MKTITIALIAAALVACTEQKTTEVRKPAPPTKTAPAPKGVSEIETPAGAGAGEPFLSATRDGILLSWLEPAAGPQRALFRFARYRDGRWDPPRTVAEANDLVVNSADFPSIVEDAKGTLFVHWIQQHGNEAEASDIRMAASTDGGATWIPSFLLNRDGKNAEHGFVTLATLPEGGVGATWLDGRNLPHGEGSGDMMLRYATIDAKGTIANESEVDNRTCECCTTGMAMTSRGPLIVYRDRSPQEIRDIAFVRREASGWSAPQLVHADNWKLNGCPVNGPQVDAIGDHAVVAWFTAAEGKPRVYASFSTDGGKTFGNAITIDDVKPAGHVDVVMLDANAAVVSWVAESADGGEIRARKISANGPASEPVKIASVSTVRAAGFPRMARSGDEVWIAWMAQDGDTKKVHVARGRF